ncbi:Transcription factor, K-box [Corchorus capsularis]|uniref:Transcription factor, K-box n=1 Tax=Corchorus capsularis TaxID=210143 RepID=A0A1R3HHA8_COCAP|nr:Transcription factor, K-box [Corchorus capsularis]
MFRDVSSCNTYNYGDALYWDARYVQEADGAFDWYQRYSSLRPFVRNYIPPSSRVLMVGCGNALMSEDMVKDGYEDIINIDISSVAIEMMRRKYEYIPQLKYMQMDVRDMSYFQDEYFDSVIDKGTLDSLMCGTDAPISASRMLGEVSRLLKPGGIYMLITYGDPSARMPHLNRPAYNWIIKLYNLPRPDFKRPGDCSSTKSYLEPVPLTENGLLPADFVLEDPDSHFIYFLSKFSSANVPLPTLATQRCMKKTLSRYNKCSQSSSEVAVVEYKAAEVKQDCKEADNLKDEIAKLQMKQLQLLGKDLKGMSLKELQHLEQQLNEGLLSVKEKKEQLLMEQLEQSRVQEQRAMLENETLRRQVEELRGFFPSTDRPVQSYLECYPVERKSSVISHSIHSPDVTCNYTIEKGDSDTTLYLGLPSDYHKRKKPERESQSNDSGSQLQML